MSKPLLLVNVSLMDMVKKKTKKKGAKAKKGTAKKKAKKKVVKVEEPVRPSPFKAGSEVWYERTSNVWLKGMISKCIRPAKDKRAWSYQIEKEGEGTQYDECQLFPMSLFRLIANDAVRIRRAEFCDILNSVFDAEATVLAVYRTGQKRPWAYYVIPEMGRVMKEVKWKIKQYGSEYDQDAMLYVCEVDKLPVFFMPVSSAPQEILTYLGLHLYNRKWINADGSSNS